MPDNPFKFWHELKRRKVIRVIIVYAAAAYVILELVSIIAEPFGLPGWTLKLVFVLLCVGLIISIVLSWIYDITPEGVKKTKPPAKDQKTEISTPSNIWKIATYVSIVIIVGLLILNIIRGRAGGGNISELEKSIAVLPFDNMSVGEENAHIGVAITDEIILELQKIKTFDRILSRSSTMQYKEYRPTIPEIAEKLGVNYIVEGSIQKQKDSLSIRVQVIRAIKEDHIWGTKYVGKWEDIHFIQDNIAKSVAKELEVVLSPSEIEQIERKPTDNPEAYNLYLLGRFKYNQFSDERILEAIQFFQDAINIDSSYAMAYVGLGESYRTLVQHSYLKPNEGYNMAKEAILRAIRIDDSLGEAYANLGLIKFAFDWDLKGAEKEFLKATRLNANCSEIYSLYAQYLLWSGRYDEGIRKIKSAIELDPLNPLINGWLGAIYFYSGQYDESIDQFKKILSLFNGFEGYSYTYLAYNHILLESYSEAISYADSAMAIIDSNNVLMCYLGWVYGAAGEVQKAESILSYLNERYIEESIDPINLAIVYAGLKENDKTFEWLNNAYEANFGSMIWLKAYSDSFFREQKTDPRYNAILQKVGFGIE